MENNLSKIQEDETIIKQTFLKYLNIGEAAKFAMINKRILKLIDINSYDPS